MRLLPESENIILLQMIYKFPFLELRPNPAKIGSTYFEYQSTSWTTSPISVVFLLFTWPIPLPLMVPQVDNDTQGVNNTAGLIQVLRPYTDIVHHTERDILLADVVETP